MLTSLFLLSYYTKYWVSPWHSHMHIHILLYSYSSLSPATLLCPHQLSFFPQLTPPFQFPILLHMCSTIFLPTVSTLCTFMPMPMHTNLNLDSAYKTRNFCLSLNYFTKHTDLQFHSFACKCHEFILLHRWTRSHCVYAPHFLHVLQCPWHLGWLHFFTVVNS